MARTEYDNSPLTPILAGLVLFAVVLAGSVGFAAYIGSLPETRSPSYASAPELSAEWRMRRETVRFDDMIRTRTKNRIEGMIRER